MTYAHAHTRGVATVPIIFVFGILTVAIGIGITALAFSETFSSQASYNAARALLYAETGARDALERVARDKDYSCPATDCYTLDINVNGCSDGSACALVSVSAGEGSVVDPKIITSKGQAGLHARRLNVEIVFDPALDGEIASTTWSEITN